MPDTRRPDLLGIVQIKPVENSRVHFGRIGAGSQVDDDLHQLVMRLQPWKKGITVHLGRVLFARQVARLLRTREIVHQHNILVTSLIEPRHHATADKPGRPRNHYHTLGILIHFNW